MDKRQVIEHYGTSAAQFARDLGTTKQNVSNWGERIPPKWAMRVSRLTGLPVERVLDNGNEQITSPSAEARDR